MATKIPISGPLTKGYEGDEPIVQGENVGGVFLANGSNFDPVTNIVTFKSLNADGSENLKQWNLSNILGGISIIYKGFSLVAGGPLSDSQTKDAMGNVLERVKNDILNKYNAVRMATMPLTVNSLRSGARVEFDTKDLTEDAYYNPWILFARSLGSRLTVETLEGESDTENWYRIDNPALDGPSSPGGTTGFQLWARLLEMQANEESENFIIKVFLDE